MDLDTYIYHLYSDWFILEYTVMYTKIISDNMYSV